jgi:hypothetical protein
MLFPPVRDSLQGINLPADWLKQTGGTFGDAAIGIRIVRGIFAIIALALAGSWMADQVALPKARIATLMIEVALFIGYRIWKRG